MTNDEIEGRTRIGTEVSGLLSLLWGLYAKWRDEGDKLPTEVFEVGYRQAKRQDALELKAVLEDGGG